jgi:hypothetical protein
MKGTKMAFPVKKMRENALDLMQLLSDREASTYMGKALKTVPFGESFPRMYLGNMQIK